MEYIAKYDLDDPEKHPLKGDQITTGLPNGILIMTVAGDGKRYIVHKSDVVKESVMRMDLSGKVHWINKDNLSLTVSSYDGEVYYTILDNELHSIDPKGNDKWVYEDAFSPLIGSNGAVYVLSESDVSLRALNSSGDLSWKHVFDGPHIPTPLMGEADGQLYIICGYV